MRSTLFAITAVLLAVAATPRAQEPAPDRSLDRMRSVLDKPPLRLTPFETEATFKVRIQALHPLHEIFDKPLWQLDPIGWQPPAVGFDLLSVFRYVARSAADAKRERDVRHARQDVQQAIADYCAVQPNANTIVMCWNLPAVR